MLNHVVLIGRLTKDPEMRYTQNGTAVTNMRLAVQRNYANQNGEREVDFIDVVAWRGTAENCAQYLSKGRLISVQGRLQVRQSESNGRTYTNTEVIANEVVFLDWGDNNKNNNNGNNANTNMNQSQNYGVPNNNQSYIPNYNQAYNKEYNQGYNQQNFNQSPSQDFNNDSDYNNIDVPF